MWRYRYPVWQQVLYSKRMDYARPTRLIFFVSFILLMHKFLLNRREGDLKSRRNKWQEVWSRADEDLPGTIVWKSFQQSRISDTHRLNMEVDPVLRIRNKSSGSGLGSGSGLKLFSDPDPVSDPNPGSGSRSKTGQIFFTKIFTQPHLQGCPPSALWLRYKQSAQKICDLWGSQLKYV